LRFNGNPALRAQTVGIATQLPLHRQRRMKCPLRMVLVRDGRACQSSRPIDQRSTAAVLVGSQPLLLTITPGSPRSNTKRSSSRTTRTPPIEVSTDHRGQAFAAEVVHYAEDAEAAAIAERI
jgi:hypothetical protein